MQRLLNDQKKKFVDTFTFLMMFAKQLNYDISTGTWSKNISWDKYFITMSLINIKNNTTFKIDIDDDYLIFITYNKKFYTLNSTDYIKLLLSKNKIAINEKTNEQITSVPTTPVVLLTTVEFNTLKNAL
jgi:hypothetical protein